MNRYLLILSIAVVLTFASCSAHNIARMKKTNMEQVELNMSKSEVTEILGSSYTISEKRLDGADTIEVISYRNFPYDEEFYLFRFKNSKLEKWSREFHIKNPKEN